jgi:ferrochelatase
MIIPLNIKKMEHLKGVLIMAYGSPETADEIEPYYIDIRRGIPPSPELLQELKERYNNIGGKSPLLEITQRQARIIENSLTPEYKAYVGMRHWKPWIRDAVLQMKEDGIKEAVGLVMAPHFSEMSILRYISLVNDSIKNLDANINFQFIESWHDEPLYIQALSENLQKATSLFKNEGPFIVIFTAHSLPERILQNGDPYKDQLLKTARLTAENCGLENWTFAFQSAGRTSEKWLGPDLLSVIDELHNKGIKNVLISSIGFVTDHLEVLYDIDHEARIKAEGLGIHLERAESLNANPLIGKMFAKLIYKKFQS